MNKDKEKLIELYEKYEESGRDFEYWMFDNTAKLIARSIFDKYHCDTYTGFIALVNAEEMDILMTIDRLRTLTKVSNMKRQKEQVEKAFLKYKEKLNK